MTSPRCPQCATPVPVTAGRGRPRTFCSSRCRVAAHRASNTIPAELRDRDRWLRHVDKRPITTTWRPASSTNPATWTTYSKARAATAGHGLGFVLGDGIGGLDLDHVIDDNGTLRPAAAELLASLPPTYTEISPSGTGLHLYFHMPEGPGSVRTVNGIKVETYPTGRYFTVTGKRWPGTPLEVAHLS